MAMNYATKYANAVDERFRLGALTNGIVNQNFSWIGVQTVTVFRRDLTTLGNYTASGTSRYGSPSDLENKKQEMTVTQDKAFTYIIDKKTEQDTNGTMEAAATLAENIDQVVIPTLDAYRLSVLVSSAPTVADGMTASHLVTASVSSSNAYEEFLKVQEILDNDKAPIGGRICVASPGFLNKIKQDEAFVKRGDIATQIAINGYAGDIDGVPTIKVPTSYLPSNTDFIITNPIVMPSPVKLMEFKIHDDAPGISGYLVEGRIRYDAFVLKNKAAAIGVHKSA